MRTATHAHAQELAIMKVVWRLEKATVGRVRRSAALRRLYHRDDDEKILEEKGIEEEPVERAHSTGQPNLGSRWWARWFGTSSIACSTGGRQFVAAPCQGWSFVGRRQRIRRIIETEE
jgi:hypothetical protein